MSKVVKKKKNNKINLSVKVHHNSSPKIKKKNNSKTDLRKISKTDLKKTNKKKRFFKKEKTVKVKGFLTKNISKKGNIKRAVKAKFKKRDFIKEDVGLEIDEDYKYYYTEYDYNEEKSKMLLMKSGVTFFMVLIFFMWIYNTKRSIANSIPKNRDNVSIIDSWKEISNNIPNIQENKNNILEEEDFKERLNLSLEQKIKIASSSLEKKSTTSSEKIEKLKGEINKIVN